MQQLASSDDFSSDTTSFSSSIFCIVVFNSSFTSINCLPSSSYSTSEHTETKGTMKESSKDHKAL